MEWNAKLYKDNSPIQFKAGLAALELLQPADQENILDIGCGDGRLSFLLAKQASHGQVTAIDVSSNMIDQAMKNASAENVTNVQFLCMDASDITFTGEFDAVYSNYVFPWIKNQKALFKKIHEALKPGGRLVATCTYMNKKPADDANQTENIGQKISYDRYPTEEMDFSMKALSQVILKDTFRQYLVHPARLLTPMSRTITQTRQYLESAGFTSIDLDTLVYDHEFEDIDAFARCDLSAKLVPYIETFPEDLRGDFVTQYIEAMRKEYEDLPADRRTSALIVHWDTLIIHAIK